MKNHASILVISAASVLSCDASACTATFNNTVNLESYYASASGLDTSALKSALNSIIKGHINWGYSCAWDILRKTDEDPDNSDNVIGFYTRRSIPKIDRDYGLNTPDAWNREHIWARSHGISSNGMAAYSDTHHLRATDKSVNADRGSKDFANGGSPHGECTGCRFTQNSWEPPEEVKGDTARMMFYMATRYEGDDGVPDLNLIDSVASSGNQFGDLCDMLQWHVDDEVNAAETARNEIVYSYQGNRNPFIDRPDYAVLIWGDTCGISLPETPADPVNVPMVPVWAIALLGISLSGVYYIQGRDKKKH